MKSTPTEYLPDASEAFAPAVSMLPNAMSRRPKPVSAEAVVQAIKRGKYAKPIAAIRRLYSETLARTDGDHTAAKKAVDPLKKKLPAVQFSGRFNGRGDKAIIEYVPLICGDIDGLPPTQQQDIRAKLMADPCVFGCFTSPSGWGLKVVIRVGGDAKQHLENFLAVKAHIQTVCGLAVDEACKNLERLCFVSDDERAYINPAAVPLPPVIPAAPAAPQGRNGEAVSLSDRRQIAEQIFGPIRWVSDSEGFSQCPGARLHTTTNGDRDFKIIVSGAPTCTCFHDKCQGIVKGINHQLRSAIGKAEAGSTGKMTVAATPDSDTETEFEYANRLAKKLPPIKTCGSTWHAYQSGTWHQTERSTLRPEAQNILPPIIRTARREATLLDHLEGRFQTPPGSFLGFYRFDTNGDVLMNAGNGVVRVKLSGEIALEPHSPDHLFTKTLAANYDPSAAAPLFARVLGEALPDPEDQALLQLCAGNFLLPDCRYETAVVAYGEAARCKSTVAEAIAEPMGRTLVPRLTMAQICDPKSYHVPKLRHAAVNLGTELDAIELGESGLFKALVSGEAVEARPIYGSPFTMTTSCKLWFLANCLPRFKHGTEAELRRTRFLRFDYLPPAKDVTLKARLAQERDGVFRWMLAGLVELLNIPFIPLGGQCSRQVHERFKISNDPVGSFVSSCCRLAPDAKAAKDTLADAFKDFSERHALPSGIGTWFFRTLYERWTQLREVRPRDEENRRRVILGIEVKL
jgi:P4 family phage/plasmid primase-like protien